MNYLYAFIALLLIIFGAEQWGEHRIQVEWEQDIAVRQALLDKTKQENKEALDANKKQYEKDKRAAMSQAGRDAVNRYIRERMLQSCPGNVPAQGAQGTNGATEEPGTGTALESFATDCASDALQVIRWQEMCKANRCEIK